MVQVTFYRFSKKSNSTKRPESSLLHLTLNIEINDADSSILYPSIRVHSTDSILTQYNYCYIPKFAGRYYWVQNWSYNADGTWTASLVVDTLASWYANIKISGGYVGRSSNETMQRFGYTKNIVDRFYPASTEFATIVDSMATGLDVDPADTFYVLGVISADNPTVGAVKYYMTNLEQLQTLVHNLVATSSESWTSVQGLTSDALKSIVNPMQYIVSCKWFPLGAIAVSPQSPYIRVYSWDTGALGVALPSTYSRYPHTGWKELTITDIPDHYFEENVDIHYFPYDAPYAEYNLFTPWGVFEIDSTVIADYFKNQIDYEHGERPKLQWALTDVNLISGTAIFEVRIRNNNRIGSLGDAYYTTLFRREIEIALDIPLAQATVDYVNMAKSTFAAVSTVSNKTAWVMHPTGNAMTLASNILDAAVAAISPTVQSTAGGEATFTPVIEHIYLQQKRYKTIGQSNAMFGRPVKHEIDHIPDLESGETSRYIQMDYTNFNAPCTDVEKKIIVDHLTNGFFLE